MAADRRETQPGIWPVLGAIAAGAVLGAEIRYGLARVLPNPAGGFAWATFLANVAGCATIGVLMTLISVLWPRRRLLRPLLGVGVLGGFTTFSTYTLDIVRAVTGGAPQIALAYLAGTLLAAMLAVWFASRATAFLLCAARLRPATDNVAP